MVAELSTLAPPPQRQQRSAPIKGKSAFVNKGKASASNKKATRPLEVVKVSLQDVMGSLQLPIQEPRVTSSPRSTDDITPGPSDNTEEIQNRINEQRELPVSQLEQDLMLSTDSLDEDDPAKLRIVNLDDEEESDQMDDVEPDDTLEDVTA